MADIQQIQKWLEDTGYTVEPVKDVPDEVTAFVGYINAQQRFEFVVHSRLPLRLLIQRNLRLTDEHRDAISALDADAFRQFRFDLLRDLLRSGAAYNLEEDGQRLEIIGVQVAAHLGDTGANDLIDLVARVRDASTLATLRVRKTAGAPL